MSHSSLPSAPTPNLSVVIPVYNGGEAFQAMPGGTSTLVNAVYGGDCRLRWRLGRKLASG